MEALSRMPLFACGTMLLLLPLCLNAQPPQITPFSADYTIDQEVKILILDHPAKPNQAAPSGKLYTPTVKVKGKLYVSRDAKRSEERSFVTIYNLSTSTSTYLFNKGYVQHTPKTSPPWKGPDFETPWQPTNPCASQPGSRCESLGVETIDERACEHWKITDKDEAVYDLWVDKALNYPSRVTSQTVYAWKLTKIREGEPNPALFQIPDGYQKRKCLQECVD